MGLNALAGLAALIAWRVPAWRGRWLWIGVGVAEVAMLVQVFVGATLIALGDYRVEGDLSNDLTFHMFYGIVSFVTIGLAYAYRRSLTGRMEVSYGLLGCFLAGLSIRAIQQVM